MRIRATGGGGSLSPACQAFDPVSHAVKHGREQQDRRQTWARRSGWQRSTVTLHTAPFRSGTGWGGLYRRLLERLDTSTIKIRFRGSALCRSMTDSPSI
ncbi:hypothetical protein PGR6_24990 [Pseudomonas sp. GR 6-02]|nr:hypothetical protein PGR6_24990 [Pseudomonas sp. GR 6-02]